MAMISVWIMAGFAVVGNCHVIVGVDLALPQFVPTPTWPLSNYYDENGPPITLSCRLAVEEGVSLLWYRNGMLLEPGNELRMEDNNQTVTLELPKQSQTGTYMCRASNLVGSVNHTGNILISARQQETRPRIVETEPSGLVKHADVGENITISCVFDVGGTDMALLDLANNWQRNNSPVQDNNHSTYGINATDRDNQVFSLTISNLQESDYGEYVCYGENQLGNDSRTITVSARVPVKGHFPEYIIVGGSVGVVFVIGTVVMVTLLVRRKRQWNRYEELEWEEPDVSNIQVPEHAVQYDVFISYSSNDLEWVKDVLFDTLVANGYSVCIDFKDFTPGMAISENIIDAIYRSRHTIVLMSKNFLKSMWGQFELQQAHNRAVMLRKDALILIKYDQSKVPVKLMGKTFLEWADKKVRPHFWQRLYEAIGEPSNFEEQRNDQQEVFHNDIAETLEELLPELGGSDDDMTDNEDSTDKELHDSGIGQEFPTLDLPEAYNEENMKERVNQKDDIDEEHIVVKVFDNDIKPDINTRGGSGNVDNFPNEFQDEIGNVKVDEHMPIVKANTGNKLAQTNEQRHAKFDMDVMIDVHQIV